MDEQITAWVTTYALTFGIEQVQGKIDGANRNLLVYEGAGAAHRFAFGFGKHWHLTLGTAMLQAEHMRIEKIASLEKQLAKLRLLKIKVIDRMG